jgi:peptidoglycan/xylan/chitin deacetylase (PgdA/CDA1 family)
VAFWVAPNVEHYEYLPPRDPARNPWPRTPHPDVQGYAHRDYGNRVGFWRMAEALDRHRVRATVSLNLAVFEHYPEVAEAMTSRGWEVMSHGIYNTRYLHSLDEDEERAFYADCVDTLRRHTGQQLLGMLGPAVSNSVRTPDLMAEAGLIYHADWMHDDQPVPIRLRGPGRLVSVPYSTELNDVPVFLGHLEADDFAAMAKAQFDVLWREGEASGRVLCLAIHPYLMGMPHRVRHLDEIFDHVLSHEGVWATTAGEIARWFIDHHHDEFVAHAARLTDGARRAG